MALSSNIFLFFDCKTSLCLIIPSRQEKMYFAQESFYLQGILDDINEQDTSFLHCKHKHMMKSGSPPDKFRVLYRMVKQNTCYHSFVPGLTSFFLDGMGPFNNVYQL